MYGVVGNLLHRFFISSVKRYTRSISSTNFLPASSSQDYHKVIKSGIDDSDEGQHRKSPTITGPDCIAKLLCRIGLPQLLERLLDVAGTNEYDIHLRPFQERLLNAYVEQRALHGRGA